MVVGKRGVSPALQQEFDHGTIPVLGGGMERNPSRLLAGVDRCSVIEQEAGGFQVADGGGGVERHDLRGVRGHGIH